MIPERDYVLGTHDAEIARLGLQHRVWQARARAAWRRAGFAAGQTILDLGCGPGQASLDLAEIVGPSGRVVAVDRSRRFLDVLQQARAGRELAQITVAELDLDQDPLPSYGADGAWLRWVFAFVTRPRELLARVAGVLRPGGAVVIHEYFDYSTWRTSPRSREVDDFVSAVMTSWRERGGEPDIALDLLTWLEECGLERRSVTPLIDVVDRSHPVWSWLAVFIDNGLARLIDLGSLTEARAGDIARAFRGLEDREGALMISPAVLEIIAVRS